MRFDDAATAYVADRYGRGEIGAYTARQLAFRLSTVSRAHPGLDLVDLDPAAVATWQHHIGGLRPASRRAYQSTLRRFTFWALERNLISADPTGQLGRIRDPRPKQRALTAGQMARLILVLPDERSRLIVALMYRLGLRRAEVAHLDTGDYDPGRRRLTVTGKNDDQRTLPVPTDLAVLLEHWIDGRVGPVFGISPSRVGRLVAGWLAAAGVKRAPHDRVSGHSLRHTAASDMFDRCHNPRTVQEALGHLNLATTEIYLRHATIDELRQAVGDI